ncbi:hypothetical protein QJS10_CPB04g00367 [Acorus calamus]|uniref:Uncharacterized protein n=1 Tax=Acorus calamus TaxID=4465 RepID=A0AAV9F040_ACOCL|nr:hypothetical protein QJS10_CPB04g00367 [Acorus calamus]
MADSNSSPGSPNENQISYTDAGLPSDNDGSIEELARKVQETLSLEKKHRFWETQPGTWRHKLSRGPN